MCRFDAGYTTITGTRDELAKAGDAWGSLRTPSRLGLAPPAIRTLDNLGDHFNDPNCPATAVVRHDPALGRRPANELQAEFLIHPATPRVICEPGFRLRVADDGSPGGVPVTVSITPAKVAAAQGSIAAGALRKVAVIDSGDLPGGANMVDFLGPATPPPSYTLTDDDHGHGSAISQLIRDLRPSVSIEAVRIVDSAGVADSFDLFLALVYSMWPGTFEIVNVSLTQDILGQCETWLGATLTFILEQCRNSGKGSNALLVAAAGNDPNVEAQYPALLPDAIVATASDWSGVSASYNSTTIAAARSGTIVQAYGGLPTDPFGTWTDRAGAQHAMWGTSFAAAVVTASYLS